jgi:hypothetical protein
VCSEEGGGGAVSSSSSPVPLLPFLLSLALKTACSGTQRLDLRWWVVFRAGDRFFVAAWWMAGG